MLGYLILLNDFNDKNYNNSKMNAMQCKAQGKRKFLAYSTIEEQQNRNYQQQEQ